MTSFRDINALYQEYAFRGTPMLSKSKIDKLWRTRGMEYGRWYSEQDIDLFWVYVCDHEPSWNTAFPSSV